MKRGLSVSVALNKKTLLPFYIPGYPNQTPGELGMKRQFLASGYWLEIIGTSAAEGVGLH